MSVFLNIQDAVIPFFFSTLASPYLELADVVVVGGALSALFQRNESEASEIRRTGCQEDHCKAEKGGVFTPQRH